MRVYKARNPNRVQTVMLFVFQIIFALLPVLLSVLFLVDYERYTASYVYAYFFIAAIIFCGFAYFVSAQRYNVLISGIRGEKTLQRASKKIKGNVEVVFFNVPVRYKRNRSEIDMILVSKAGLLTVEVKNHAGVISGDDREEMWYQYKHYRDGKSTENEMMNPVKQANRQREILKNILRSNGIDIWIDSVVVFSNPTAKLKLNIHSNNNVVQGEAELIEFIREYASKTPLDAVNIRKITEVLKSAVNGELK